MKLKNINFGLRTRTGLRSLIQLIPTHKTAKRNFEKFLLEATKSGLENLGVHFETDRTVCMMRRQEVSLITLVCIISTYLTGGKKWDWL